MWGWFPIMIPYMTGTHCSDIIYLFDCNYFSSPFSMTKKDRKISKWTSTSFMQFVKTGNPNIPGLPFNWEPVSKSDEIRMLNINEKPAMAGKVFDNRIKQIDSCFEEILLRRSHDQLS
nr:unnamed protein product [Haemonchus contortus]